MSHLARLLLCLLVRSEGSSLGEIGQLRKRAVLAKKSAAWTDTVRMASGNWTGLMNLRFDPETLEVLQTSDYGLRAAKSSPWTVFFSSKGDKVGEKRSRRLQERCQEEGLKCIELSPEKGSKTQALALEFLMGLRVWEKSDNSDAVIFAEDDTVFIPNFGKELHRSLKQLPATWQAFWLCPGFLHSRKVPKPLGQAFKLNPEGKLLSDARRSVGGRVYLDWPLGATDVNRKGVLAGGPATGVIKKSARPLFRKALKAALAKGETTDAVDVIFRNLGMQHPSEHFLAAEPQLCVEERSIGG
ncbi:unnamed protein product [Symbiodinium sp. KB8]|nr:unnamed protein product [Symbiodinium sp. KB8]